MTPAWSFLPIGYTLSVLIEMPVLLVLLSSRHPIQRKVFAGLWLTACTYPIVALVLPPLFTERLPYLLVAETFAPAAECALFGIAYRTTDWRDFVPIVAANLASFGVGEALNAMGVWG